MMSDRCKCIEIEAEVILDEPEINAELDFSGEVILCSDGEDYKRGYEEGHAQGLIDGRADGYQSGYDEGHKVGSESGYQTGKQDGLTEGYDNGYTQGKADGYKAGYDEGYQKGYTEGYEKGLTDGTKEEQEKFVKITENSTTEITPDENKVLSKVTVEVDIESGGRDYTNEQVASLINRSVTKFTIPYGVKTIGNSAFRACTELKMLNIPDTVIRINPTAFAMCYSLKTELPDGVTFIGDGAFNSNAHQIITRLPLELKTIGRTAFQYCYAPFTLSEIPSKVETIGAQAFHGCDGFTELTFKGTPTSIATNSFKDCTNLLNIYVPWAEGEVANAPWGATNATIHYNSEV